MSEEVFTCPRCFFTAPLRDDIRFCPHCGLPDAKEAFLDHAPLEVTVGSRQFRVLDRIAIGSISTVYRCKFASSAGESEGVFKIARDARANDLIASEARILRELHAADTAERFSPFLPIVEESLRFDAGPDSPARQANILRMHPEIRSPDELYSLLDVKAQFPSGLDQRDAAWIWRRLLSILGFIHERQIVHTMVLPMHVMIEPRGHKLVLIDWCCAQTQLNHQSQVIITGGYRAWYNRFASGAPLMVTRALDIDLAARTMIDLMGGDATSDTLPATVDPALQRYFQRCLNMKATAADAFRLLDDFDRLIETLWGPRKFRVLTLAPKVRG
ncbi:MAG TPA: inactive serine/threonine-protein kinase VRK3 [Tepidisphaeraceae bacterium]|jgi:hypothetical protein|nr:inactive serine/threonine-protein kinase VRK3 [Tepidisphaeraceae bacterium]